MKNLIIGIAIATTTLAACNSGSNNSAENKKMNDTTKVDNSMAKDATPANNATPKAD